MCKQKITERCVNISKIKIVTFFRPLLCPNIGQKKCQKVERLDERRKTRDESFLLVGTLKVVKAQQRWHRMANGLRP